MEPKKDRNGSLLGTRGALTFSIPGRKFKTMQKKRRGTLGLHFWLFGAALVERGALDAACPALGAQQRSSPVGQYDSHRKGEARF